MLNLGHTLGAECRAEALSMEVQTLIFLKELSHLNPKGFEIILNSYK